MLSLPQTHTPASIVGVKRESELAALSSSNSKRRVEIPEIIEIEDDDDDDDDDAPLESQEERHPQRPPHQHRSYGHHHHKPAESATRLIDDSIEWDISQLDNSLIKWEVARSISGHSIQDQQKVLSTKLPSDPRSLNLSAILEGCELEYEYDAPLSIMIDQLEQEIKAEQPRSDDTAIQRLIRSGNVRFAIDLSPSENGMKTKMTNARIASSNELLRLYGSDSWIQFQLSETLLFSIQHTGSKHGIGNQIWQFFHRPLRFAQRIYRSALVKDECVWFFTSPCGLSKQVHVTEMIDNHLPLKLNRTMKISKFNSRLQLGLSTTAPSVTFDPTQIRRVPDICSNSLRISKELMAEIATKLHLSYVPSAIAGAHEVTEANYIGQQYTWALFDPVGLSNDILLEVWNSDHIERSGVAKFLKFQFNIPVYVPLSRRWKDVRCEIVVPKTRILIKVDKPNDEVLMTDGAAAIGWGAALGIKQALGLEHLPGAYQARILKSKGLWYLSPDHDKSGFWIEIRSSQWKGDVRCKPDDRITFNICNVSTRAKAGNVNRQSIPVIASRNVPISAFTDRQREKFKTVLDSLTSTEPTELCQALEVHGHLLNLKAKRLSTATNSHVRKEADQVGSAWEKYSNRPMNVMEEIIELLKTGFNPRNNRLLDRLNLAGKEICDKMMNFKIEVASSATVYVIPDPTGTLEEGEVFLRLSRFRDPKTSLSVNILKGDCVVARSPCVAPTDARKVKAVTNSRLMCYEDVLVCSIHGQKSLLDYLSGGDYDGDVVIVIWDDAFTQNFINADDPRYILPTEKYNNFFSDAVALAASGRGSSLPTMKVQDFLNLKAENNTYEREFRRAQLVSLFQPVAYGRYSRMYKVCEYLFGIDHPLTMKLGYVYTKCLDAMKQGIVLKAEADQSLKQEFEYAIGQSCDLKSGVIPLPFWTSYVDISNDEGREWNVGFREQEKFYLPVKLDHVLEAIAATAVEERRVFLLTLQELEVDSNDPVLNAPWDMFTLNVKSNPNHAWPLMEFIESNARACFEEYEQALRHNDGIIERGDFDAAGKIFWIDGEYSNALRAVKNHTFSKHFLIGKGKVEYNILRASALAAITPEQDFFPFHVVFNELCHLRSQASEEEYQAQSGINSIGHCPRAFAPEFCQAMMARKSLLPPREVDLL
ncbi:hypothetical protein Pst134EA_025918 [Puccinia striiformis f. sp. tritici]|uniref:hypothetical protein n=1 Tax=Puccinia striiformis f. sp. tritici TaxID=168172 RepID=UPI00200791DA|nr:hypothetical protein Pst134EA_025918 [Puccinia striiformis f. sp. tritici]KAH9451981.1 hypothetical protein Pst134EA_025918 [Puccinia striiformis f. sp. tritici]